MKAAFDLNVKVMGGLFVFLAFNDEALFFFYQTDVG
jgi:hypothetical protein